MAQRFDVLVDFENEVTGEVFSRVMETFRGISNEDRIEDLRSTLQSGADASARRAAVYAITAYAPVDADMENIWGETFWDRALVGVA
jgi:hypothetical protein